MTSSVAVRVCIAGMALCASAVAQMTYHARIVLEDGTPLPRAPLIRVGTNEYLNPACRIYNVFGNGNVQYATAPTYLSTRDKLDACPVTIRLAGYRPANVVLRDGATVVLKRLGTDHEGSTVSMTALKAPEEAQKAYEKGVGAATEGKWENARKSFEKAVGIYPEYAPAWSELADVYVQLKNPTGAQAAIEKAMKADPKYIRPYVQLARLKLDQGDNQGALEITTTAIKMKQVNIAPIYFFDAVAKYNLKQYADAAVSAQSAVDADADHEIPRAEYILAASLSAQGDLPGAVKHLKRYLEIAPKAPDVAKVKEWIADLETRAVK